MQSTVTSKKDLRAQAKATLKKLFLDREDIYERQNNIVNDIEMSSEFKKAETILLYYPLDDEFDLTSLIISNPNKVWLLPRAIGKGLMLFFEIDELHTLKDTSMGKVPPSTNKFYKASDIDLLIVPGLAFDKSGYRLGRGKAYYDVLFSKLDKKVNSFGVIAKELLLDSLPVEAHDKPVKKVIAY